MDFTVENQTVTLASPAVDQHELDQLFQEYVSRFSSAFQNYRNDPGILHGLRKSVKKLRYMDKNAGSFARFLFAEQKRVNSGAEISTSVNAPGRRTVHRGRGRKPVMRGRPAGKSASKRAHNFLKKVMDYLPNGQ